MGTNRAEEKPESGVAKKAGFELSREPVVHGTVEEAIHAPSLPPYEDLGALPVAYGSRSLFLVARDPRWLFTYWDIDWEALLPVPGEKVFLKVFDASGAQVHCAEVDPFARNWYLPAERAGVVYYAEIGHPLPSGGWEAIARSNEAATPPDGISPRADGDDFATVPYHLAFQRMLDLMKEAMREGETLLGALARIQNEGRRLVEELGSSPNWTDEQRRVLAALLGHEIEELMRLSTQEVDSLLRGELERLLSSERWSAPAGRAGEAFGSWGESSFAGGVESSFSGSWPGAAGREQFLSSWLASWGGAAGASWLASWPQAMGAGESAFWSSWLSSWAGGASWGGASGAFGSRELGASWSAQPFGRQRGFFLHVNAEVIFYGGTEPGARVWVNNRPVALDPEGNFRFHFTFPDGGCSIPIEAESPDGLERRSATLHFQRHTRREGEVGSTPQPDYLPALGAD